VAISQRVYESACPGCGAAVSLRSAASTHAVCGYCQSTVVRNGDALEALGKAAQIFDDYSPLQLYAQGKQDDKAFTLIGRLQYDNPTGRWTEWIALFDDGRSIVLSEDNGSFVWLASIKNITALPTASQLKVGNDYVLLGSSYTATSVQQTRCIAAQGEFEAPPVLNAAFLQAELRSADGVLLSLSYDTMPPSVYLGRAVDISSLRMTGLKDASSATLQGRQFNCPNCASPVEVKLDVSKSVTCAACNSIIDLSQGIGGELRHALQNEPIRPQIALGTVGTLEGKSWQVVGYQHRIGTSLDTRLDEDADEYDESFGWEEYLLYNAKAGFLFLCDTTEGWTLVKPATGSPTVSGKRTAKYLGALYTLQDTYQAQTVFVLGEFYWPVKKGYKTVNKDYASGAILLNREQVEQEITWSVGSRIGHRAVMTAFGIKADQAALFARDASPTSFIQMKAWLWPILFVVGCATLATCTYQGANRQACEKSYVENSQYTMEQHLQDCKKSSSYRSGGGSYGGYSSGGGGHK
jgi:hypothetical protein